MPSKMKFGKNSKLKGKMRGGMLDDAGVEGNVPSVQTDTASMTQRSQAGSSYTSFSDQTYISIIVSIGIGGLIWMAVSRAIIRHKYSEVVAYGLIGAAITFSLLLILFKGVRNTKPSSGILGAIKNILGLAKFLLLKCTPAILILVQIVVLCNIMYTNADYIFSTDTMPTMFTVFNLISMAMIIGQSIVWKDKVVEIMTGEKGKSNPMALGGFILAAILSGVAISQLYIILEYLRTDC